MKLDIEFAFEGFRIIRKYPWAVAAWGLFLLVVNAVCIGAFLPFALPPLVQMFNQGAPTPALMFSLMAGLILPYLLLLILTVLAAAVISCAVFRAVLSQEKPGFGFLRLGSDELRLILVHLIFGVLIGIANFVGIAVTGLLAYLFSLIKEDLAGLGVFIGIVACFGTMIWVVLRLSLFSVQSFDEKRINLFGSWKLTKGSVWTLLGGYLLALILCMVVETIVSMVIWIVMGIGLFANLGALQNALNSSMPDIIGLLWIIGPLAAIAFALYSLLVQPLLTAILLGAPAAAYRSLSDRHPNTVEKVF